MDDTARNQRSSSFRVGGGSFFFFAAGDPGGAIGLVARIAHIMNGGKMPEAMKGNRKPPKLYKMPPTGGPIVQASDPAELAKERTRDRWAGKPSDSVDIVTVCTRAPPTPMIIRQRTNATTWGHSRCARTSGTNAKRIGPTATKHTPQQSTGCRPKRVARAPETIEVLSCATIKAEKIGAISVWRIPKPTIAGGKNEVNAANDMLESVSRSSEKQR